MTTVSKISKVRHRRRPCPFARVHEFDLQPDLRIKSIFHRRARSEPSLTVVDRILERGQVSVRCET
jgi:hypothetical protein